MNKLMRALVFCALWGVWLLAHIQIGQFYYPKESGSISNAFITVSIIGFVGYIIIELTLRKISLNNYYEWLATILWLILIIINFENITTFLK